MAHLQEEATKAVSAALTDSDGNLLASIDAAQQEWRQELGSVNATARKLFASVLSERELLRSSLGTAAELWRILKPDEAKERSPAFRNGEAMPEGYLANGAQIETVKALQNVSHTIYYLEFIIAAPEALGRAHAMLEKLRKDGLNEPVAGNAALLVEAHGILTGVERLRDLILLESSDMETADASLPWFPESVKTRALLEDIVLRQIFTDVVRFSQMNPRLLVAAARIVESEEAEDEWWRKHMLRAENMEQGELVRPFGAQEYRKCALETVVESLRSLFVQKERDLGITPGPQGDADKSVSLRALSSPMEVVNILDWIEHRRSENETVRRFVVPCLPPSFQISSLYEKELHRQFMRLITQLLHLVHPDGSMMLSETDLIMLTNWYCKYQVEIGDHDEAIDSFLSDDDRQRLISALQKHCVSRISAKITAAVSADRKMSRCMSLDNNESQESEKASDLRPKTTIRRSDLPDVVLGCINDQVKRMLALKIRGMDQAIAETAANCLLSFQGEVHLALSEEALESPEERYRLHACTTANNMARCLEYSEDLRDLFIPLASDQGRPDIEERMEQVIEGFRMTASRALKVLIYGMDASLRAHASRLYAPHTGTEIMLDVIATLEDYFSDYQAHLLPYHFEHLAIESLKRVVVWYLAPFLRVGQNRIEESSARRFTSLPTFDEMNSMALDFPPEDCDTSLFSKPTRRFRAERNEGCGLQALNGAAVVAQIDKDRENLTTFMASKVILYQKKQLQPTLEALHAIRSLYTCPSTTFGLSDAFRDAKAIISRALRPAWVTECGVSRHVSVRVAEVIWESRKDINPVVLLEAVNVIRSLGDEPDASSVKEGRMSSFDDGRFLASKTSNVSRPLSERVPGNDQGPQDQHTSSSSLLWAPSTSRSPRSNVKK